MLYNGTYQTALRLTLNCDLPPEVFIITQTSSRRVMILVYSAAHFLVDFACAFLVFRGISLSDNRHLCLLIYNFCAFAMQMPLGIIADNLSRNHLVAAAGCLLVCTGYALTGVPLAAVTAAGLGNALFHVGGGIDVLNVSEKKMGALGVFVSPGAFGIYFGTMLGRGTALSPILVILALIAAAILILIARRLRGSDQLKNAPFSLSGATPGIIVAAACLFLVVCLRSYVGLTLSFPWKGTGIWGIVLVCAVVFGKTAGGFAADRLGASRASLVSLGLAALLFLMPTIPVPGVISVLLFNMTMPVTLWAMARAFPGAKGFTFGLLTFGLFLGFLPVHLSAAPVLTAPWMFTIAAAVSLVLLLIGLRRKRT